MNDIGHNKPPSMIDNKLVERLRAWRSPLECHQGAVYALASEAADEIERLRAERDLAIEDLRYQEAMGEEAGHEIERLRAALTAGKQGEP